MNVVVFPGQGAQFKGMGREVFPLYREMTDRASEILGYSIVDLCLDNPGNRLNLTQYTQPAMYVVSALNYFRMRDDRRLPAAPDYLAGHSLGEYNALLVAEAFDFETGLRLVQKRGALMGNAIEGAMAAIIGVGQERIQEILVRNGLDDIDIANFNTPSQFVVAGPAESISKAERLCAQSGIRCVVLNVSAPFHSRYMASAKAEFEEFARQFDFRPLRIPVIANVSARPYENGDIRKTLCEQISGSVQWTDSIRYLMAKGADNYIEIGNQILTKMIADIRKNATPLPLSRLDAAAGQSRQGMQGDKSAEAAGDDSQRPTAVANPDAGYDGKGIAPHTLGSTVFRKRFNLKYAYVSGGMYRGIASPSMVVRMGKAGCMGFFGTGGLSLEEIEAGIRSIGSQLDGGEPYGANLLANYIDPEAERKTVELYFRHDVRNVEAAAFMQMTPALVLYRLRGLSKAEDGAVVCKNRVLAKVSRPEVAEAFMSPPPEQIVQKLLAEGAITLEQAQLASFIPMSHDICVEADSGGHTDGGIPSVLFPAMSRLREDMERKYRYREPICIGLAGGIGTPEAAASAFIMGADFILTGSINQCTVDAGMSEEVKNMLQEMNVQDTEYAPAGDMFEMGSKVQVLKKGVFFPARANKLHALYTHYDSLEQIPEKIREQLQKTYFKKSFDEVWEETKEYLRRIGRQEEISKALGTPKFKMSLIFRWYFGYTTKLAFEGAQNDKVNYQVHTGPALGAFNRWVKGTEMESWRNRHADKIGLKLLTETAELLNRSYRRLTVADGGND